MLCPQRVPLPRPAAAGHPPGVAGHSRSGVTRHAGRNAKVPIFRADRWSAVAPELTCDQDNPVAGEELSLTSEQIMGQ